MKKTPAARAAIAVSSATAALLLTSCGAPALTMGETEIKVSKAVIADLETQWDAHRGTQPASNVSEDSGCYLGATDGEMTGTALCGPVRYLGQDATGWDQIKVDVVDTDGKAEPVSRGTFVVGSLDPATELIRSDDRGAVRDQQVKEPEALKTVEPLTVFSTGETLAAEAEVLPVVLPQGTLSVTAAAMRERAGSATDRTAAPEGFRMASVSFDAEDLDRVPENGSAELSFIVDGTDYPFDDQREGGTVSIAVPEDSEVSFGVTFDKEVQTVSVPDMKLDAGEVSALYAPKWDSVVIDEKIAGDAAWRTIYANRSAHTTGFDLGWAGKDQVWIKASLELIDSDGYPMKKADGMKVVSAVMTTADGTSLETVGTEVYYWASHQTWSIDAFYRAPADTGETTWNVTTEDNKGNVYTSGPLSMGAEKG